MGRAAEILGVTPAFLRSLDTAKLITRSWRSGLRRHFAPIATTGPDSASSVRTVPARSVLWRAQGACSRR